MDISNYRRIYLNKIITILSAAGRKLWDENPEIEIFTVDDICSTDKKATDLIAILENKYQASERVLVITDIPEVFTKICDTYCCLFFAHKHVKLDGIDGIKYAFEDMDALDPEYLEDIYRRCRKLPLDIIVSDRLYIRETTRDDVADFYRLYSDPSITRYMEPLFEDVDEELIYADSYRENIYEIFGYGVWTVCLKETEEIIGRAGIEMQEGQEVPELSYMIGVQYQHQGYAKEACRAILEFANREYGFSECMIRVNEDNKASIALCKSLGAKMQKSVGNFAVYKAKTDLFLC